jgi:uncharacterized protein with NRDE domain
MCLILVGYQPDSDRPLVVAANRDEFHERASAPADFWPQFPELLAGKDLVAGGTWLGCTQSGKFAGLTNFNQGDEPPTERSRGSLVHDFLVGDVSALEYAKGLPASEYAGYNLFLFDGNELIYTSNIEVQGTQSTQVLAPGYYGLSNAQLGATWPKCTTGTQSLAAATARDFDADDLLDMLNNRQQPSDELLPQRGQPIEHERRLAPCFIVGGDYGTRACTAFILHREHITFAEQSYAAGGKATGLVKFELAR